MNELVKRLEAGIGRPARVVRQPSNPADLNATHADLTKARRLLRYHPQVPFPDGLDEYVAWFLEQASQPSLASVATVRDNVL